MSKFFNYFKYVIKHKWQVFKACCKLGIPLRGITHDLSKFYPDEFIPYMNHFYGEKKTFETKEAFNKACSKHFNRNEHHWQYHVLREYNNNLIYINISDDILKEMVADWVGTGIIVNGKLSVKEWYDKNREYILMNDENKAKIREYIQKFY